MKKTLTIAILFVMIMMATLTVVNAATSETLADELYAIGSKYGMTSGNKVQMERYLAEHALTEKECNDILSLAQDAQDIMKANNTTDVRSLDKDVKARLLSLANEAADIAGVTLDFTADGVAVYKDGKLIDTVTSSDKLAYTGNNVNTLVIISSVMAIGLAVTLVAKKKLA